MWESASSDVVNTKVFWHCLRSFRTSSASVAVLVFGTSWVAPSVTEGSFNKSAARPLLNRPKLKQRYKLTTNLLARSGKKSRKATATWNHLLLPHFLLLVIKSIRDAVEELLRVCHSLGHLIARGLLLDDGCLVGQVQRVLVVRGDLYVLLGTLLQALPSSLRVPRATVAVEKADHTQNQPVELHVVQGQLAVVPGPVAHVTDDEGIHLLTAQKMRSRPPVAALV